MGLFAKSDQNKQDVVAEDNGQFSLEGDADIAAVAKSKRASSAGEPPRRSRKAASADADDPMLPEKKRARRRLVGAIALALGVAIGLPMILDTEPKPLAADIAIEIPSRDKAPPLPMPAAATPGVATPAAAAADVATVTAGGEPTEAASTGPTSVKATAAAPVPVQLAPQASVSQSASPAGKPLASTAGKQAAQAGEDQRARAILEDKPVPPKPAAPATQKFVVQVGAFSTAQKAADVRARLGKAGITAYTEKMKTGTIRVRVGPFASRAQAEQARARVDRIGMKGNIVPVTQ